MARFEQYHYLGHTMFDPRLPAEILDEIVSNLHNDRHALAACSLAASTFLPAARHHLFSEVVLESSAICVFLRLLDVPWSTIAPAVRSVVISETAEGAFKGCKETQRKKGYYVPENPKRLRERMQGVHSITFSDISLADIAPPFWRLLNDLKGVKKLVVHQMSFDTPGTFFQYICSLPALETLSISRSSWEAATNSNGIPPTQALPPALLNTCKSQFKAQGPFRIPLLDIGRHSQFDIMEWFLMQRPVPPVHTFRIHLDGCCATTAMIRQYIEEAGESVQQLHIDMPTSAAGIQRLSTIDFSPCTGLKGVHIEGLRISSQQTQSQHLSAFMHSLFTSLRTPDLCEVTAILTMDTGNDAFSFFGIPDHIALQSYTWGSLPEILQSTFGGQIKQFGVAVRNYPRYQHEWSEGFLRKGPFRWFGELGVLNVEFPDPPAMDAGFWSPIGFSSLMRFANEGGLVNGNWGDDDD